GAPGGSAAARLRRVALRVGGGGGWGSGSRTELASGVKLPVAELQGGKQGGWPGSRGEGNTALGVSRWVPEVTISEEPETLYKRLSLLVKGHDKAVLDSYEYFAVLAAKELGISVEKIHRPPKKIERFTLLKSVHIYKKHRVQYEMRTHYTCLELKYLTGSTAAVYLEYVERNLPEGVAMEVKKTKIEKIPEHIQEPVWDTLPQVEETEVKS
uniref:Small ribosomal subunit protein uS10m n=2 Tax=Anas platyrhynchos TaxID=8839 RepID=A0A493STB6_ANAPP